MIVVPDGKKLHSTNAILIPDYQLRSDINLINEAC